jgi:hypothetical protein
VATCYCSIQAILSNPGQNNDRWADGGLQAERLSNAVTEFSSVIFTLLDDTWPTGVYY